MEENSEVQVGTDVSSTTIEVPGTVQVPGIHSNVETTIYVEEIKEEHINRNVSAEASPTRPNPAQVAVISPKVPSEQGWPKKFIISPTKVIQLTHNDKQSTPINSKISPTKGVELTHNEKQSRATNSKEVSCISSGSAPENKTPTKTECMQTTSTKSEQVLRKPPILVRLRRPSTKLEHVQKIVLKSDQVPSTPNKSQVVQTTPMLETLQKVPPINEQMPTKISQLEKNLKQSDLLAQQTSKIDQISKTPPKELVQKTPPKEQVQKTLSEQVDKKLDQFKKYLGLKSASNSDHLLKRPTKSEQAQKISAILEVNNKLDQVKNTLQLTTTDITMSNPREKQVSKDAIDTEVNNALVKTTDVPETIVIQNSIKETKQTEELAKKQELSKETLGKPDPVSKSDHHSNKSNKTSIQDVPDQQTSNKDCFDKAIIKEFSDKVKGDKNNDKKLAVCNTSIDICQKLTETQVEINSDVTEKDHNKSISRELKSLIKSAKESKIISECTQLTSKTRKSRTAVDSNNTSLNTSVDPDKVQNVRRSSINSQESNCSEKSEKAPIKRSMRSQNPEFVNKVKLFLNSVTGKGQKGDEEDELDECRKEIHSGNSSPLPKKKKLLDSQKPEATPEQSQRLRSDLFCWRCHWVAEQAANEKGHPPLLCTVCPRSFHYKCLSGTERNKITNERTWICPECLVVLHAESSETRSLAMKKISLGHLCELLKYALERMMDLNGVEPFMVPVDTVAFPDYEKYVVHPMDLSLMKKNIIDGLYGSTEAFLADAQWILHNSIIFNTCMMQSKLTGAARALVRSCRAEMGEIEACPECYSAAHARRPTWFTDVCSTPHMLLWAKLKGFPYWPAKGMSVNSQGLVDVRFFGAHDRAWVPARDCFLYCEKDPNNFKAKRQDILESMHEAEDHIRNITQKYGKFVYAAFKTHLDPTKLGEQLKMMIPAFDGEVRTLKEKTASASPNAVKNKSRSNSKSSKSSVNESDVSESEDAKTIITPRKMADGAEIAREKDYLSIDKNSTMEVDEYVLSKKEKETLRKRRRSGLVEAVITIMDTSTNEKRKKIEDEKVENDKKTEIGVESTQKTEESLKYNNKTDKTAEKVNDKDVPIPTPASTKDEEKVPINNVEKQQIVTTTPIKAVPKVRPTKTSTPKEKEERAITPKQKSVKSDKNEKDKHHDKSKSQKRSSRNKSLNCSQVEKVDKNAETKSDKGNLSDNTKDKVKETIIIPSKYKEGEAAKPIEKADKPNNNATDNSTPVMEQMQLDENISLAVLARDSPKQDVSGLPTITSVRSLSTAPQSTSTTTNTTARPSPNTIEITIAASNASNVFTPSSSENVRNMEAVEILQNLRTDSDKPVVGRVGVRSFARMTSPPAPPPPQPEIDMQEEVVEVEVKNEPVDFDDADRQVEKLDLMKSFHLRPVNPPALVNLRDVRINKVVATPVIQKPVAKTTDVRARARKTFPQPRKDGSDSRSELNGKNSMVYIPIKPPTTQAPAQRPTRPITINGNVNTQTVRPQAPTTIPKSVVNTLTTPHVTLPMNSLSNSASKAPTTFVTNTHSTPTCVPTAGQIPNLGQGPTIGQVPNTVHTVPLLTSVNGQWTFSLQPMMSVGGDGPGSQPVLNGLPDRNPQFIPVPPCNPLSMLSSTQLLSNNSNSCSGNSNNNNNNHGENTPVEMPRLQQRPSLVNPFDPNAPAGTVPIPSSAGPLTAKLSQNAVKLADFFRNLLEDSLEKIDDPTSQATLLKVQLEQAKWKHQQEVNEMKHTHELLITEMRVAFEKEKARTVSEMRRVAQVELEAAVKSAKTKQWCANCNQEAQFYCCWNTSYCDYSCQRSHWTHHFATCTQQKNADNNPNENGSLLDRRLQPASDNLPVLQKSSSAPAVAVGSKITPTRVYAQAQDGHPQKTSIIVSMVEDPSGNPMVKCVGTYKSPGTQQVSPLLINKQILNDENAAKKVMTTGGYLIVGAGNNAPLTTTRRNLPVQFAYNT
ncbi:uncharacterized protein LOC120637676 isoform X2 [Pararge aegeria]|nr:uncharacterized protein LOC120637676 isoform X2 [Pararge aegeria]